jgi:signal transduction histidine kinase
MVGLTELILRTTPYELHPSIDLDTPQFPLLLESFWSLAIVVLMIRQPASDLWKLLLFWTAVGQIWAIGYVPIEPAWAVAAGTYLLGDLWAAVFVHLILAFPSGRPRDRFDRWFIGLIYGIAVGVRALSLVVTPDVVCCGGPFPIAPAQAVWDVVRIGAVLSIPLLFMAALVELARHWRAAGPAGRRALLPMLLAAPLWCVFTFAAYFADAFLDAAAQDATHGGNVFATIHALLMPSAIIAGAFMSRLARGNVADLAIALGRGVPVGGLRDVLARALRDPSLELAFPAADGTGLVDSAGQPLEPQSTPSRALTRVERDGELLAVLIHDPLIADEDPGLVAGVGSVARMALENERLAAQVRAQLEEVRASRARIVDAADAERRRVERDLHDGAQQRLVALAMRLDLARQSNDASAALLDDATAELRAAVAEVRDLARGLHPPILTEAGLGPALEALAERASVPVTIDAPERRYPAAVESAAYFVVAEALTNVARYASATAVRVEVRPEGDRLSVSIRDDGQGGADAARGTGLSGLADRIAALGGRLEVDSPAGGGTTVSADLPLPA